MIVNRGFGSRNIITKGYGGIPAVPAPVTGGGGWSVRRPTYRTLSIDLEGTVYHPGAEMLGLTGDIFTPVEHTQKLDGVVYRLGVESNPLISEVFRSHQSEINLSSQLFKKWQLEYNLSGIITNNELSNSMQNDELFLFKAFQIIQNMNQ